MPTFGQLLEKLGHFFLNSGRTASFSVNRPVLKQFAEALNSSHVRSMLR